MSRTDHITGGKRVAETVAEQGLLEAQERQDLEEVKRSAAFQIALQQEVAKEIEKVKERSFDALMKKADTIIADQRALGAKLQPYAYITKEEWVQTEKGLKPRVVPDISRWPNEAKEVLADIQKLEQELEALYQTKIVVTLEDSQKNSDPILEYSYNGIRGQLVANKGRHAGQNQIEHIISLGVYRECLLRSYILEYKHSEYLEAGDAPILMGGHRQEAIPYYPNLRVLRVWEPGV